MSILSTTEGHTQFAGGGGGHHLNELARRREKMLLPAQYDTVRPVCKKPIKRDSHELLIAGKTYVGDDRDSKAHLNIFFDDFPASRFEGHVVRDAMLLEHRFDHSLCGQMPRRQDQPIAPNFFELD